MSTDESFDVGFTDLYNWDCEADGTNFVWRRDGHVVEAWFDADASNIEVTVKQPDKTILDSFVIDVSPASTSRTCLPGTVEEITRAVQEQLAVRSREW